MDTGNANSDTPNGNEPSQKSNKSKHKKSSKRDKPRGLTARQQRFVEEYLIDLNATAAAGRAGYSDPNFGRQLLTNPNVADAISAALEVRKKTAQHTADDVLKELAMLAFSDIGQIMDFGSESIRVRSAKDIPESARRALASLKVKRYLEGHGEDAKEVEMLEFKMIDKLQALVKYGQHLGMFKDKVEHTGKDGGPIEITGIDIVDPE